MKLLKVPIKSPDFLFDKTPDVWLEPGVFPPQAEPCLEV